MSRFSRKGPIVVELFFAVTALFGGGFNVGMNTVASGWSVPTALDVAAVLEQGTLITGRIGGLNWLSSCYSMQAPEAGIEMVGRTPNGYASLQNATEDVEEQLATREAKNKAIQQHFSSPLIILSVAINIVEWLVVPFFGLQTPDHGTKLELSKQAFAQGYDALELALPDPEQWKGPAAAAYATDTKTLQDLAVQAGIDGRAAPLTATSLDTELQRIIDHQARQVELMRLALSIIVAGLSFCVFFALAMEACAPGSSLAFQLAMFILGVGAAGYVWITISSWTADNADDLDQVAEQYRQLTAQVPSAVPPISPGVQPLAEEVSLSGFTGLGGHTGTPVAGSAALATRAARHYAPAGDAPGPGGGVAAGSTRLGQHARAVHRSAPSAPRSAPSTRRADDTVTSAERCGPQGSEFGLGVSPVDQPDAVPTLCVDRPAVPGPPAELG